MRRPLKFSILINLFNKQDTIVSTITSVLSQSYSNFELIIIDFHSTDLSFDFIKIFKDPRIFISRSDNEGIARGKNLLSTQSSGEYIIFLDADDIWDCNLLANFYQVIQEFNPDIIASGYQNQLPSFWTKNSGKIYRFSSNRYLLARIFGFGIQTSFTCIKKIAFSDIGGFPYQIESDIGYVLLNERNTIFKTSRISPNYKSISTYSIPGPGGEDQWVHDYLTLKSGLIFIDRKLGTWRNDILNQASTKHFNGIWPVYFIPKFNTISIIHKMYMLHQVGFYLKGNIYYNKPSNEEVFDNLAVSSRFVKLMLIGLIAIMRLCQLIIRGIGRLHLSSWKNIIKHIP